MKNHHLLKIAISILLVGLAFSLFIIPGSAFIGDINLDNHVDSADLYAIGQSLGLTSSKPSYSRGLDLNLSNEIDVQDLAIAGRSYAAPHIFHYLRQISNKNGVYDQDSCIDGSGNINIIWGNDNAVFFSRLDRFGNTLIDDVQLAGNNTGKVDIGCDQEGNAHMVWVKVNTLYQARFDQWGYQVLPPSKVYDEEVADPAIYGYRKMDVALDQQGNAYAFFNTEHHAIPTLLYLQADGDVSLAAHPAESDSSLQYHQVRVDHENNIHLMWYQEEGTDRIYYARYGSGDTPSLSEQLIGYTAYDGFYNGTRPPDLEVDSQGNAYILWHRAYTTNLYLEKITPGGNHALDDFVLFSQWDSTGYNRPPVFTLDANDNLHLLAVTGWGRSSVHSAYGSFTSNGDPLLPMRWFLYGEPMGNPQIMVDGEGDIQVTFSHPYDSGYPPCPGEALCHLGTALDAAAQDLSRSDLGVDAAHLDFEPLIARWGEDLAITTTIFNEGWFTSTASSLSIALETEEGQSIVGTTQTVNPLAVHTTQTFTNTVLSLPGSPPSGLEEMEYFRLHLEVDPDKSIAETSEENNSLSVPILVQKLPTKTGLFLIVEDETDTARGGSSVELNVGTASIAGGSYSKTDIPVSDYITVLGKDIPVGDSAINYTINWQAAGYAAPTSVTLGVQRNSSDPYTIDYSPSNTAVLKTNRWGSLSGTITDNEGNPLSGATVRLEGEGLSIETTTDASGNFSPDDEPNLAKLIPGQYQIRVSKAGYERQSGTIEIQPLQQSTYTKNMPTTTDAYLHGNVINDFGHPVVGATVSACGNNTQTDQQGVFDLTLAASCTSLVVSKSGYTNTNETFSLTAGLETLLANLSMDFDPTLTTFGKENRVASRVIDQSTADLLPDPPEDASWLKKKVFDQFKDKFWPDYGIYIVYGAYNYNASAAYSGPSDSRMMNFVQARFDPQTFEAHMFLTSVEYEGVPIPVPIISDSGIKSAIQVIEARLVNAKTGEILKQVFAPEGGASEEIFSDTTLTYDFEGVPISTSDWNNAEVWLYYKVGMNDNGKFDSSPLLYQYDQQIMKFDLSSSSVRLDYGLEEFPLP